MRVVEAARLIVTGNIAPDTLWQITSLPERVTIALLVGRPDYLPPAASTPTTAWNALDSRARALVLRRAPARVLRRLPGYTGVPQPFTPLPRELPTSQGEDAPYSPISSHLPVE